MVNIYPAIWQKLYRCFYLSCLLKFHQKQRIHHVGYYFFVYVYFMHALALFCGTSLLLLLIFTFLMVQNKIKMNIGDLILVTSLSVILVIMYSAENNLSLFSASALPAYDKGKYFVNIQDDSENELGAPTSSLGQNSTIGSTNQTVSGLTDEGTANGAMSNDTGEKNSAQGPTNSLDEGTTNGAMSNDTGEENLNQTSESSSSSSAESQSSQNANQSVESQNQLQANQSTEIQNQIQNNPQIKINNTQTNNIQLQQRLDSLIIEREGEKPIPLEEQKRIETQDVIVIKEHKALTGPNCRTGNVLSGASNEKDLRVLSECQDVIGVVKHTKKMDDGDYKFFLDVDKKYDFLLNDKNREKTDGFLVVEIVPKDQDIAGVYLPKSGDQMHIWGAWVTDKPKGWHEIHPAWKVANE
jgi:hypothetical protein